MEPMEMFEDLWKEKHGYYPEKIGDTYKNDTVHDCYMWFLKGAIYAYRNANGEESDETRNERVV